VLFHSISRQLINLLILKFGKMAKKRKSFDPTETSDLLGGRYQIQEKVGSGSFGDVHAVFDVLSGEVRIYTIFKYMWDILSITKIEVSLQNFSQLILTKFTKSSANKLRFC